MAGSYAARITATRTSTSGTTRRFQGRINQLKAKKRTTDRRYTTRIAELARDEAKALASRGEKVARLTEKREAALTKARDRYRGELDAIEVDKGSTRANVAQDNEAAMADHQLTVSHHGGGLAWFTVVCLIVLLVSIVVKELHHAGAGNEKRVQPDPFCSEEGPLQSLYKVLTVRSRREVYCLAKWVERTTPDALTPHPVARTVGTGGRLAGEDYAGGRELPGSDRGHSPTPASERPGRPFSGTYNRRDRRI
ncbi:hypothetical protein LEM8419_03489 [Neolewinella maritima]|uniref:Uncharacterized protein n=1 Tax=Neolewinella maritima TaxID=1383882 RepID=A0ABM9B5E2_9BACT|nr:hypothetical protein [Neolewinella maritima]CAH1002617.1 hypothetical protein LEM8419_03489 [Neolewinella maritima]